MTAEDAAAWMLARYHEQRFLYQEEAASYLLLMNTASLAYYDAGSNACVGKAVLAHFNKATPGAVYERAGKFWRDRLPTDQPGRQQ